MQRTMLVAVNASAERLIAPWYLMRICPLAFSSSAQKDDNYSLGPSGKMNHQCYNV